MAEYTTPSLTTVRMPTAEMAIAGVNAAIAEEDGEDSRDAITLEILEPTMVIRQSTGPVRVLAVDA
jgi:DNA-binding LacI/PurR family transcriptional regulator